MIIALSSNEKNNNNEVPEKNNLDELREKYDSLSGDEFAAAQDNEDLGQRLKDKLFKIKKISKYERAFNEAVEAEEKSGKQYEDYPKAFEVNLDEDDLLELIRAVSIKKAELDKTEEPQKEEEVLAEEPERQPEKAEALPEKEETEGEEKAEKAISKPETGERVIFEAETDEPGQVTEETAAELPVAELPTENSSENKGEEISAPQAAQPFPWPYAPLQDGQAVQYPIFPYAGYQYPPQQEQEKGIYDKESGMRIIYQAPEGNSPGYSAEEKQQQLPQGQMYPYPYTVMPGMMPGIPPEYFVPQAQIPVPEENEPEIKNEKSEPGQDYLANMKIIYDSEEGEEPQDETEKPEPEMPPKQQEKELHIISGEAEISEEPFKKTDDKNNDKVNVNEEETSRFLAELADDIPKKKSFFKRLFPEKGDGAGEVIRKIVFLVSIVAIIVSSAVLLNVYVVEPYKYRQTERKLAEEKEKADEIKNWEEVEDRFNQEDFPQGMLVRHAGLYLKNNDFAGWFSHKGLKIELPVTQYTDNSKYLKLNFEGEKNVYGTLFYDYRNNLKKLDRNTVIYGHNTRKDFMFGSLVKLKDIDVYKNDPLIECGTLFENYNWKIYAVFITNAKSPSNGYIFNYYFTEMESDEKFAQYVEEMNRRRLYDTGVDILPSDKILTLSTCTYEFDDARFVVVARMVREGESTYVDTSKAALNSNPQYPQEWYSKKGIKNPFADIDKWYYSR